MQFYLTFHKQYNQTPLLNLPVLGPRSQVKKLSFSYGERFCERLEAVVCQAFLKKLQGSIIVKLLTSRGVVLWSGLIDQRPISVLGDGFFRASGGWYLATKHDVNYFTTGGAKLSLGSVLKNVLLQHSIGGGYASGSNEHYLGCNFAKIDVSDSQFSRQIEVIDYQHWKVSRFVDEMEKFIDTERFVIGVDPSGSWTIKDQNAVWHSISGYRELGIDELSLDYRGILNTFVVVSNFGGSETTPLSHSRSSNATSFSKYFTRTEVQKAKDVSAYSELEKHSLAIKNNRAIAEPTPSLPSFKVRIINPRRGELFGPHDLIQGKQRVSLAVPGWQGSFRVKEAVYEIFAGGALSVTLSASPRRKDAKGVLEEVSISSSRSGRDTVFRKGD